MGYWSGVGIDFCIICQWESVDCVLLDEKKTQAIIVTTSINFWKEEYCLDYVQINYRTNYNIMMNNIVDWDHHSI